MSLTSVYFNGPIPAGAAGASSPVNDSVAQEPPDLSAGCLVKIESGNIDYNKLIWQVVRAGGEAERVTLRLRNKDKEIAVRRNIIKVIGHLDEGCFVELRSANIAHSSMIWQFVRWSSRDAEGVILRNGEKIISTTCCRVRVIGPPPPEFTAPMGTATPSASIDGLPAAGASSPCVAPHDGGEPGLDIVPATARVPVDPGVAKHAWTRGVEMAATVGGRGADWRLNTWFPLPLLGGNAIMVKECDDPNYNLAMFPNISRAGLEMWFRSTWSGHIVRLEDFDYLKKCPQDHYWPYCCWCRKFLLPVEPHRCTAKHQKAKEYMRCYGAERCRQWILNCGYLHR